MDLCTALRAATDPLHREVEALPMAQAMADGTIGRDDYAELLKLLLTTHRLWEPEAATQTIWDDRMGRVGAIERDLTALGYEPDAADHPACDAWIAEMRDVAATHPAVWLGVIYLFEGSRMGSMALLKPLAKALGVPPIPGRGLDYHADGLADRVPRWLRTKAMLNALPLNDEQRDAAVRGAVSAFELLRELYSASALVT